MSEDKISSEEVATAPFVKAYIGGCVQIEVPRDLYDAEDAYELVEELMEATYLSRALQLVDGVMKRHRDKHPQELLEWRVLDAAWGDLRKEFGWVAERPQ